MDQPRVERIRDVPDRVPLEVALEERRPAERQVGVHVAEIARLGGNEARGGPAGRDESKIPHGQLAIPPTRCETHSWVPTPWRVPLLRGQQRCEEDAGPEDE